MSDDLVVSDEVGPNVTGDVGSGSYDVTTIHSAGRRRGLGSVDRPRRRFVVLGVVVGLLVGGLVGSLVVALAFPRPDTSAIDVAQQPVRVTVAVSEQPVRSVAQLSGVVTAPAVVAVLPNAANGVGLDVVSGRVHAVGDVVNPWDVVGEVSDRPVFAVLGSVPLFRDLAPDMSGTDVWAVQQALIDGGWLKSGPSGTMDVATSNALTALFRAAGYSAPLLASVKPLKPDPATGVTPAAPVRAGLPLADTAWIPAAGLPVAQAAPVGRVLDSDHPLVSLTARAAVIMARADMLAAPSFQVGVAVDVRVGADAPVASTVLSVSGFNSGGDGTAPGYDVTVAVPDGVDVSQASSQPVTVTETDTPPTGLAVPLLAVRTDNGGSFVWKAATDGKSPDTRVDVSVTAQANGYAIVADNPGLPVGALVVLSGERS